MKPARPIASLGEIAEDYDAIICDVWGVVHDGRAAWPDATAALKRFREARGPVILLSNAPRPSEPVIEHLAALGVAPDCYDAVLTSGDATREELARRSKGVFFHLGPERDRSIWAGLDVDETREIADASLILCSGLFDDERDEPEDYRALLAGAAARRLPMICANPDLQVHRGPKLLWCAGAVAELYEQLGGEAIYLGKPHPLVYDRAVARLREIAGREIDDRRMLAIGDGMRTDILGANRAGIDALFISGGLHVDLFGDDAEAPDAHKVVTALDGADLFAEAFMPRLKW